MARKGALKNLQLWWDPNGDDDGCRFVLVWDLLPDDTNPFINLYPDTGYEWQVGHSISVSAQVLTGMGWRQIWP